MTYDELIKTQAALESALLSGAAHAEVTIGERRLKYKTTDEVRAALAEVNRSICRYNRKARGATHPAATTPVFTYYG